MTAEILVLPGEDAEAITVRVAAWKDEFRPEGERPDYLVGRAAHASWQLDRCDRSRGTDACARDGGAAGRCNW